MDPIEELYSQLNILMNSGYSKKEYIIIVLKISLRPSLQLIIKINENGYIQH